MHSNTTQYATGCTSKENTLKVFAGYVSSVCIRVCVCVCAFVCVLICVCQSVSVLLCIGLCVYECVCMGVRWVYAFCVYGCFVVYLCMYGCVLISVCCELCLFGFPCWFLSLSECFGQTVSFFSAASLNSFRALFIRSTSTPSGREKWRRKSSSK